MKIEDWYAIKHRLKRIPGMRALYFPFIKIQTAKKDHQYLNSEFSDKIKKFQNIHSGQRCFIIGNGPSLTTGDLELIKSEICFATNRIYNLYNETAWRPTYFVCVDPILLSKDYNEILNMHNSVCFIGERGKRIKNENILILNDKKQFFLNPAKEYKLDFSEDVAKEIFSHSTVLYTVFQLALYMGFKEIILLGVDHSFKYTTDTNNKIIFNKEVKKNHFLQQNETNEKIVFDSKGAELDYLKVKEIAEKNNVNIYNATKGGNLEIFQRVTLDAMLEVNR